MIIVLAESQIRVGWVKICDSVCLLRGNRTAAKAQNYALSFFGKFIHGTALADQALLSSLQSHSATGNRLIAWRSAGSTFV